MIGQNTFLAQIYDDIDDLYYKYDTNAFIMSVNPKFYEATSMCVNIEELTSEQGEAYLQTLWDWAFKTSKRFDTQNIITKHTQNLPIHLQVIWDDKFAPKYGTFCKFHKECNDIDAEMDHEHDDYYGMAAHVKDILNDEQINERKKQKAKEELAVEWKNFTDSWKEANAELCEIVDKYKYPVEYIRDWTATFE